MINYIHTTTITNKKKQVNVSNTVIVCAGTTADKVSHSKGGCTYSFFLPVILLIAQPYYFHFHAVHTLTHIKN